LIELYLFYIRVTFHWGKGLAARIRGFPLPEAPVVQEICDSQRETEPWPPVTLSLLLLIFIQHKASQFKVQNKFLENFTSAGASDGVGILALNFQ
jgi:hypothetical protein